MSWIFLLFIIVSFANLVELKLGWEKNSDHWQKDQPVKPVVDDNNISRTEDKDCDVVRPNPQNVEVSKDAEKAFKDLAREVIADDRFKLKYCEVHTHPGATEIYGDKYYKLLIPLTDFDPDNIQVKIIHRVLFMRGEVPLIDPRGSADGDGAWADIRTLPHYLDIMRASWLLQNGKLEVTVPYKFKLGEEENKSCEVDYSNINEQEIVVPMGQETDLDKDVLDLIFGKKNAI